MKKRSPDYLLHNNLELIQGGKPYFDRLLQMIAEAETSIHFQFYIFDQDNTGMAVADALKSAARRGVKVYLLFDGYGSQSISKPFVKSLVDAGIFLRRFRPLFKSKRFYLGRRLHHKVVVVDSYRSLVSGLNISDRYNDMPGVPAWLDWALYAEGEVSASIAEICQSRLRLKHRVGSLPRGHALPRQQHPARPRVNDWVRRKRQIYRSYLEMFRDANSRIIIMSAYFLPGRLFRRKIAAARKRGVKIKVVLTADADIFLIKYAERYIYRWLFKNDIEVYEYRKSMLHGKLALRDGQWMTVGSYNVNNLSAYGSIELNVDVDHAGFVGDVEQRLEKIIREDCVRMTEKKFNRKYNYFNLLVHKVSYEIFRFLFFLSTKQGGD